MTVEDTEYQKEYDAAAAALEAAATATTADAGQVAKVDLVEPKTTPEPEPAKAEDDPLADIKARLEKAEKVARDNQAWATKQSQENAQFRREREQQQREASKPAILDANPELAEAIRHVVSDPEQRNQAQDQQAQWQAMVDRAHPGIFSTDIDPELEKSLMTRLQGLGESLQDPLIAIREITEEKLAHAERQIGKRFAAESAKLQQKSAMSVPGAGAGGSRQAAPDPALAEVQRIQSMSDSDFAKEVRRVKGY